MLLRCTAPIALFFSLAYAGETWPDVLQRSLYSAAAASCEVLENYPDHHYFDQHCPFVFHHVPCTSQELSDRFIGKMRELFGGQSTIDSWTEAAKWRGTETLSTVIGPDNMCCAREVGNMFNLDKISNLNWKSIYNISQ
jgi:hypothetical protein